MINWNNLEIQEEDKIKLFRSVRNRLLLESDWTQLSDSTVNKELWATYRQELRDLTNYSGNIEDVVFPENPEEV
jgi:hypothetical protein